MSAGPTVTVAGAGVLGLASAIALADAGCRVTVRDPGGPNASSVAAGMIAPAFEAVLDPSARPHLHLLMAARDLWPALAARAGIPLERTGAMAVGDPDWLEELADRFTALRLEVTEVDGANARSLSPGLSARFDQALLTGDDWRLEAPAALAGLWRAAADAGVGFETGVVRRRAEADVMVLATGAMSDMTTIAPELVVLQPIKGHIVRVAAPAAGPVVRARSVYAAPGPGMTFGATMEAGVSDVGVDQRMAEPLLAAGLELFPGLRGAPVQVAAGIRGATPDGLPIVGASRTPGVILAAGARRNGWLLAPLVAQVVRDHVTGRDPGPYGPLFDPARFSA